MGWASVVSIYNRQLGKESVLDCIFVHFVNISLNQKHIVYSHLLAESMKTKR